MSYYERWCRNCGGKGTVVMEGMVPGEQSIGDCPHCDGTGLSDEPREQECDWCGRPSGDKRFCSYKCRVASESDRA